MMASLLRYGPQLEIARCPKLVVIEDACQARGARIYAGRTWKPRVRAMRSISCFSFYPGIILGIIATEERNLAEGVSNTARPWTPLPLPLVALLH
jgi:dTDP-4-amino-4,6-dideoxygalactose transaminase